MIRSVIAMVDNDIGLPQLSHTHTVTSPVKYEARMKGGSIPSKKGSGKDLVWRVWTGGGEALEAAIGEHNTCSLDPNNM